MNTIQILTTKLCKAIAGKNCVRIYYRSKNDSEPSWREIEPYLVAIDKRSKKIKVVGFPTKFLQTEIRELRHYLFEKMTLKISRSCLGHSINYMLMPKLYMTHPMLT